MTQDKGVGQAGEQEEGTSEQKGGSDRMEFLTIVTALATAASKLAQFGILRWGKRKEVAKEIEQQRERLAQSVRKEGQRIQSYLTFDGIIADMEDVIATILSSDDRWPKDADFWKAVGEANDRLNATLAPQMREFTGEQLTAFHLGKLRMAQPLLLDSVAVSGALFEGNRPDYVQRLRTMRPQLGTLHEFGRSIITVIAGNLAEYRGVSDGR